MHRGNGLREGSSESKRRKKNKTKNKEKETSATTLALLQESGNRKNKLRQNPKGCPARMDNSESFRNLPFGAIGLGAPSRRIANLTNATPPSGKLAIRVDLFKQKDRISETRATGVGPFSMPKPNTPEELNLRGRLAGLPSNVAVPETEAVGNEPEEGDPVTRLKRRVLKPIQERIYGPLNRLVDRLGYTASVALFLVVAGGGWLGVKFWNDPEDARRLLTVARYYIDARELKAPRDANTVEAVRDLTNQLKDDVSPANRDRPNGSFGAWTQAQMVVGLQGQGITDVREMSEWFESQAGRCGCWHEFTIDPPHAAAGGWVLLAFSRLGVPPAAQDVEFVLKNQHKPGWWGMFPGTDDPGNASTYATALSIWSLQELLRANLIPAGQKEAVARAIAKGRTWLLDNAVSTKPGRWKDYPNGVYGLESVGISGLTLHVLHKTPGPEPNASDSYWMANLPKELPMPKDQVSSSQIVVTNQSGPFVDPTHHFLLPWLLIGTADAYPKGKLSQRAQAAKLFHQIPERREAIARDLKDMPWLAAETVIALRYLRGEDVI